MNAYRWYPVLLGFDPKGIEVEPDEIQGTTIDHALDRAKWNWPSALSIEVQDPLTHEVRRWSVSNGGK